MWGAGEVVESTEDRFEANIFNEFLGAQFVVEVKAEIAEFFN